MSVIEKAYAKIEANGYEPSDIDGLWPYQASQVIEKYHKYLLDNENSMVEAFKHCGCPIVSEYFDKRWKRIIDDI